jgi:hypothetical protein
MRDRRCAHLAPTVTPLEPRASCVVVITRTSRGTACSSALEVPPPRGSGDSAVGVLGPTAHLGLPLKVLLGVGRCYRL